MQPPIDGGTILVTGASSGIGLEISKLFAGSAKTLVLVARRGDRLEALKQELKAAHPDLEVEVRPADLSDLAAVRRLADEVLEAHGRIDILVNNAGFGDVGAFSDIDEEKMVRMIAVNVTAPSILARRFLPAMLVADRGGILNISSGWGLAFGPGFAAYVGTKHYVTGLTESLRVEMAGTGIVVTQICPGPVATEFLQHVDNPLGKEPPRWAQISGPDCAKIAVRGFKKGRALVVPGWGMRLIMGLNSISPRWLLRLLYAPAGKYVRTAGGRA